LYQILILALVLARILREIKETSIESFQLYFVYDLKLLGRLGVLPDWSGVVPTGLLAEFAGFLETGNGWKFWIRCDPLFPNGFDGLIGDCGEGSSTSEFWFPRVAPEAFCRGTFAGRFLLAFALLKLFGIFFEGLGVVALDFADFASLSNPSPLFRDVGTGGIFEATAFPLVITTCVLLLLLGVGRFAFCPLWWLGWPFALSAAIASFSLYKASAFVQSTLNHQSQIKYS
jgi:hypothetical protein